jgi:hypothetical protein
LFQNYRASMGSHWPPPPHSIGHYLYRCQ